MSGDFKKSDLRSHEIKSKVYFKFCKFRAPSQKLFLDSKKKLNIFLSILIHTYRRRGFKRCYTGCIVALCLQNIPVKIFLLINMEKKKISVQNLLSKNYESKEYVNTRWAALRPVRSTSCRDVFGTLRRCFEHQNTFWSLI